MDERLGENLSELAWLAFFAEQRGWSDLADKIATDAAESRRKQDDLQKRRREQGGDDQTEDEAAA